jgi:hypothetical protein
MGYSSIICRCGAITEIPEILCGGIVAGSERNVSIEAIYKYTVCEVGCETIVAYPDREIGRISGVASSGICTDSARYCSAPCLYMCAADKAG